MPRSALLFGLAAALPVALGVAFRHSRGGTLGRR